MERDAVSFLQRQLEDPVRFARIKRWFYVGLAVVALAEIFLPLMFHDEDAHSSFPAFGSLYGLASCVAIIVVSKFLGKVWLMRREDHYE